MDEKALNVLPASALSVTAFASVWKEPVPVAYTLKEGESLSTVLFKMGIGQPHSQHRLYGRNGWLARIEKLNPGLHLNKLEPGQKIILPGIAITLSKEIALEAVPVESAPAQTEAKAQPPEAPVAEVPPAAEPAPAPEPQPAAEPTPPCGDKSPHAS